MKWSIPIGIMSLKDRTHEFRLIGKKPSDCFRTVRQLRPLIRIFIVGIRDILALFRWAIYEYPLFQFYCTRWDETQFPCTGNTHHHPPNETSPTPNSVVRPWMGHFPTCWIHSWALLGLQIVTDCQMNDVFPIAFESRKALWVKALPIHHI